MSNAHELSLDELAQYFHLPIAEAAKEIGVCATVLKKICRKNNVPRWPHRKIKSINKMIQVLEASLGKNETDDTRIKEEIKILMQHREFVMKNPDTLVKNYNKRKRPAKESDDEDSGDFSPSPAPPVPKRTKVEERSTSSRHGTAVQASGDPRIESSHDEESLPQPQAAHFHSVLPAPGLPGALSVEDWMRLTNAQHHPSVVGFPTYTMPMVPYMHYGYPPMDGHDPLHPAFVAPPPEYPHLVPVEALAAHSDLHALPQPTSVPHLIDGQVAMLPMTHMPPVDKQQAFHPAAAPGHLPVTGHHPSLPLIPGHMPHHQLPEWFDEEKGHSLNVQEKMGLV